MSLSELIVLESQLKDLLARLSLSLISFLPVALVHIQSGFHLSIGRSDTSVILMNLLDVLLVLLRLLLLLVPQVLNLGLILVLSHPETTDL